MANGPYLGPAVVREIPPGLTGWELTHAGPKRDRRPGPAEWMAKLGDWYTLGPHGCWIWRRQTRDRRTYLYWHGLMLRAHRAAYEAFRGRLPDHTELEHCGWESGCVNPEHQRVVLPVARLRRKRA